MATEARLSGAMVGRCARLWETQQLYATRYGGSRTSHRAGDVATVAMWADLGTLGRGYETSAKRVSMGLQVLTFLPALHARVLVTMTRTLLEEAS